MSNLASKALFSLFLLPCSPQQICSSIHLGWYSAWCSAATLTFQSDAELPIPWLRYMMIWSFNVAATDAGKAAAGLWGGISAPSSEYRAYLDSSVAFWRSQEQGSEFCMRVVNVETHEKFCKGSIFNTWKRIIVLYLVPLYSKCFWYVSSLVHNNTVPPWDRREKQRSGSLTIFSKVTVWIIKNRNRIKLSFLWPEVLRQWFLSRGNFAFREHLTQTKDIFYCHNREASAI